jgi:hypothetical protein
MSLIVDVFDKIKNTLREEKSYILLDDDYITITYKLELYLGYIKPFTLVEYKDIDGNFHRLTDYTVKSKIYVTDLADLIQKKYPDYPTIYISKTAGDTFAYDMIMEELLIDFPTLKENSINREDNLLDAVLKYCISVDENIDTVTLDKLQITDEYIDQFISSVSLKSNDIIKNAANEKFLEQATIYTFDTINALDTVYSDISFIIKGPDLTVRNFIKIQNIFNTFELSENIPFIALSKKQTDITSDGTRAPAPFIKIHNTLIESVDGREIKSWVLNEKKKLDKAGVEGAISYKIIKGLLFKSKIEEFSNIHGHNYLTINIMPSGIIYANVKFKQANSFTIENITEFVKQNIDNVLSQLNEMGGIFLYSQHLNYTKDSSVQVVSFDSIITTDFFINRSKITSILNNKNNFYETKDTKGTDFLSLNYLKDPYSKSAGHIFTINIKDNPFVKDSSIITIFGAKTEQQINIILLELSIFNDLGENKILRFTDIQKRKAVKAKSKKKLLKESGVNFDSRTCQGERIPSLIEKYTPNDKANLLVTKKIRGTEQARVYKCNDDSYTYPGFTKYNTVCCFKNNQTGNENFIRNIDSESLNILVQPSNKKVKIGKEITLALKISDGDGADLDPFLFYYINTDNKLEKITDLKLNETLSSTNNIWLDPVPLSNILYPSSTKYCAHTPDLINRKNINSPCDNHKDQSFFGYNTKSIPCCFDRERPVTINLKKKEIDWSNQYILKSDKLLNYKKLGYLSDTLLNIFSNLTKENYYRMGVIQNNSSFLNAIILSLTYTQQLDFKPNGIYDFKNIIVNYLNDNTLDFKKSRDGNTFNKYGTLDNYIESIKSKTNNIHYQDTLDIIEKIIKCKIILLDISNDTPKIICTKSLQEYDNNIILLYRKNTNEDDISAVYTFELLVSIKESSLQSVFSNDNEIIKFLKDYNNSSCIKENQPPLNFTYIELPNYTDILDSRIDVKYQIVNIFNRTSLLMDSNYKLIPISETGIIADLDILEYSKMIKDYKKYLIDIKNYSDYTHVIKTNINGIIGIVSKYNYIIPCISSDNIYSTPILPYIYYLDIDEKLATATNNDQSNTNYNMQQENINKILFNIKVVIGYRLGSTEPKSNYSEAKDYILSIIKHTELTRIEKINSLVYIINQLKSIDRHIKLSKQQKKFLLEIIANEMINDNVENLILNNIITTGTFNKNEVIKRPDESVLLNIDDIKKWIQQRQ